MAAADDAFFDRPAAQPRGARSSPLQVAPAFEPPRLDEPIEAARAAAAPPVRDALLQCLVWLTRHHGKARSAESLRAGQPVDGPLMPDQALRLLREAGYNAGLLSKRIPDINPLLLPAILLLGEGDACVLARRLDGDGASGLVEPRYEVVFPDDDGAHNRPVVVGTAAEIAEAYSGFVLVATPREETVSGRGAAELLAPASEHWLWGTLKRFVPYYRSAMLAALLSNVLLLVTGLVTAVIFDKVIPHAATTTLWTLAIGAFIALAFDLFARQLRSHLIDLAGRKTDLLIGSRLFRQTLGVRMEHKPESAGAYAHYLGQIELVRDFFSSAVLGALTDLPFVLLFIAMTFVIAGPLGWVLCIAVPCILGLAVWLQLRLRRAVQTHLNEYADLQGTLVEAVEGLEDLKTSGAQGRFIRRYEATTAVAAETSLRTRSAMALSNNLTMTAQQGITLVMLIWGVYLIQDGLLSSGALVGAVMFASRALAPLSSLVGLATRYQGARAAMISIDELMRRPQEREARRNYVALGAGKGRLKLADVGFAYPLPKGVAGNAPKVLRGVNLVVEPGERVAVLGRIGSGKSTILRLLAGLYQPVEGSVDVDGIDLRQVDPAEFRARVGFVSQEPRLFNGTLRDNVSMGRPEVDALRLAEVARLTGLDRLVSGHPQGWDLGVGEMGGLLSGGQRQLVALARALVHRPQILLMDEPTSSMDAQSELAFLRQLKDAVSTSDGSLVVVTHRPAVLELVQRIVVVDGGRIVMDGPRDAVLAALSGAKPAAAAAEEKVRHHPSAQPVQRQSSV
ncbi:type I secretion system permease/ATPase [Pseudorhodoferax sp.]|jgi:ATP-binding cassette subfamily C protein LapB|uniref:type I secretion system permease/ATPase n=1 Tax=Pseudorhodoferax sp. TaxID=1993553 RepID=UPI001B702424|nr:type I secretion system permease/ATPase [Pseudorhodoferax sp.]MBP8144872.1 type I secretion system permease/ATPase [Inhella sp.]